MHIVSIFFCLSFVREHPGAAPLLSARRSAPEFQCALFHFPAEHRWLPVRSEHAGSHLRSTHVEVMGIGHYATTPLT